MKDADLMRRLMHAAGLTARQVSRELGWSSHSYLNRILTGQVSSVTDETATRLCELLEVPVPLLFVTRDG